MTDISQNFRTFLLASAAIQAKVGQRIHAVKVPQETGKPPATPFIWFRKRSASAESLLNPSVGEDPDDVSFDVECVDRNNELNALDIAGLVRTRANNYSGAFGDKTRSGVFVNDQDDEYEPQSTGGDDSFTIAALDVRVRILD